MFYMVVVLSYITPRNVKNAFENTEISSLNWVTLSNFIVLMKTILIITKLENTKLRINQVEKFIHNIWRSKK